MNDFSSDMNVKQTVEWSRKHFGDFVAANIKNEEMDGRNLVLLARSPDCTTLLNRLGINRIKDILRFQELLHVLRPISCSSSNSSRNSIKYTQNSERPPHESIANTSAQHFDPQHHRQQPITSSAATTSSHDRRTEGSISPLNEASLHVTYSMQSPQNMMYASSEMADKAFGNLQQKIIRNETRKKWPDTDLPTFRRIDTTNNEELDAFVDNLLQINALSGMGKELIRKKIIGIIRERRKYVSRINGESRPSDNMSQPSFTCAEGDDEGVENNFHYQEKVEVQSDTENEPYFECDNDLTFPNDIPRKKPRSEK